MDTTQILHQFITKLTEDLTVDKGKTASKSFVFLDSKTINLLLLYILMNKELQLKRLTNRNVQPSDQKKIVEEIEQMIQENKQSFEEILKELTNN